MEASEAKRHLDTAWNLICSIPVSGDFVDILFSAKQELRAANKALEGEDDGG